MFLQAFWYQFTIAKNFPDPNQKKQTSKIISKWLWRALRKGRAVFEFESGFHILMSVVHSVAKFFNIHAFAIAVSFFQTIHFYTTQDCLSGSARIVYFIPFLKTIAACTLLNFEMLLFQTHTDLGTNLKKDMNINEKEDGHTHKKIRLVQGLSGAYLRATAGFVLWSSGSGRHQVLQEAFFSCFHGED